MTKEELQNLEPDEFRLYTSLIFKRNLSTKDISVKWLKNLLKEQGKIEFSQFTSNHPKQ